MPEACVRVLAARCHRTALRSYSHARHDGLRAAIAATDGVTPAHVFIHNGSGPILKQVIPEIIRRKIKQSPWRVVRHLLARNGYPIVTPLFTYSKVPAKAADVGLTVRALATGPERGFRVRAGEIAAELRRQPSLVYLVHPNNPSGNVMISRDELEPVIAAHPDSTFWIDEAYVQYCPDEHTSFAPLVPRYANLCVSRSFSFAYGLAGAKVGYMLAAPELVAAEDRRLTEYRIGELAEALCVAALGDREHLVWLRGECERARASLRAGLERHGIEVFPSLTNFSLCRFRDGRSGAALKAGLAARGVEIKAFSPFAGVSFEPYFRVTLGLAHEHERLLAALAEVDPIVDAGGAAGLR